MIEGKKGDTFWYETGRPAYHRGGGSYLAVVVEDLGDHGVVVALPDTHEVLIVPRSTLKERS